jgi:hypothetical protein
MKLPWTPCSPSSPPVRQTRSAAYCCISSSVATPSFFVCSRIFEFGDELADVLVAGAGLAQGGSEASPIDYFSVLVEGAVMAPDIAADRDLNLGLSAWNFSDEVLRQVHGNSLSLFPKDLLIPFFGTNFIEVRNES